jgi:pSer/pThr/pTyr-binding forkhead associated (FHA) protein/uncharacterized protein involved in exopolysaccharide biosynthesis
MNDFDPSQRVHPPPQDLAVDSSRGLTDLEQALDAAVGGGSEQSVSKPDAGAVGIDPAPRDNLSPSHGAAEMDLEQALDLVVADPSMDCELAPRLVHLGGLDAGRVHVLGPGPLLIGRSASADLRILSHSVSSEHARVECVEDRYRLVDLSSTNGTWVNGQRVTGSRDLRSGDTITVADTELRFMGSELEESMHTAVMLNPSLLPATSSQALVPYADPTWRADLAVDEERPATFEDHVRRAAQVAAFVRRYWPVLVLFPALGAAAGTTFAFIRPPPSEAVLDMSITPSVPDNAAQRFDPQNQHFYAAAQRAFTTRTLIRQTLESLGESDPPPERISGVERLLQLKSIGLGLYRGTFTDARSDYAVRLLEQHTNNYLKSEVDKTIRVVQQEVDFLTGQVKDKEEELRTTEQKLREFKQANPNGMPDQVQGMLQSAAQLEPRKVELSAQVTRLNQELELAKIRLRRGSPLIERRAAAAQPYEAALVDARRQLAEAKASGLGDEHPTIKRLNKDMGALEKLANRTASSSATDLEREANPEYTRLKDRVREIEAELAGARAELGAIGGHLGKLDQLTKKMPEVEAQYAQLSRSYESNTALYRQLFERHRQAQVRLELERNSVAARYEIIVPPHSEGADLRKSIVTRAGIFGFAGLAIALVIAVARELATRVRAVLRRDGATQSRAITVTGSNASD